MMEEMAASLAVCWTEDTMHTAREVTEDPMMEKAASLIVHAQMVTAPLPSEHVQSLLTTV
jgi:hypothetical protein